MAIETVPANDRYSQQIWTTGAPLTFDFDFPVYAPSSVAVFINDTMLEFTEDYTVDVVENAGGTVTLLEAPNDGDLVTLVGATPLRRDEDYSNMSVVPPGALNVEMDKTMFRFQQLDRDIGGCLQNPRSETEQGNTVLPNTALRSGKVAIWNSDGALSYSGDGSTMDPTSDFLRASKNLSDIADADIARENLGIIQGHVINDMPQRKNLVIQGNAVEATDSPLSDTTFIRIVQSVVGFNDLQGVCPISKGGTGATTAVDARNNLGLATVASTGSYSDLANIPTTVGNVVDAGAGVGLVMGVLNRIAQIRSLTSVDGSVEIRVSDDSSTVDFSIFHVIPEVIDGILPPEKGGTGFGLAAIAAAPLGAVIVVNEAKTGYVLRSLNSIIARIDILNLGSGVGVNIDYDENNGNLIARTIKAGNNIQITLDTDNSILVTGSAAPYVLPISNHDTLGGVKIGDGVSVTEDGIISVASYVLPTADADTLGGVKIGTGLSATADGTLSISTTTDAIPEGTVNLYNVQSDWDATSGSAAILNRPSNVLVDIAAGTNVTIDKTDPSNPIISSTNTEYVLPPATGDSLGGVIVGDGLAVTEDGVLSSVGFINPMTQEWSLIRGDAEGSPEELKFLDSPVVGTDYILSAKATGASGEEFSTTTSMGSDSSIYLNGWYYQMASGAIIATAGIGNRAERAPAIGEPFVRIGGATDFMSLGYDAVSNRLLRQNGSSNLYEYSDDEGDSWISTGKTGIFYGLFGDPGSSLRRRFQCIDGVWYLLAAREYGGVLYYNADPINSAWSSVAIGSLAGSSIDSYAIMNHNGGTAIAVPCSNGVVIIPLSTMVPELATGEVVSLSDFSQEDLFTPLTTRYLNRSSGGDIYALTNGVLTKVTSIPLGTAVINGLWNLGSNRLLFGKLTNPCLQEVNLVDGTVAAIGAWPYDRLNSLGVLSPSSAIGGTATGASYGLLRSIEPMVDMGWKPFSDLTLPVATTATPGVVSIGSGLTISSSGVLSAAGVTGFYRQDFTAADWGSGLQVVITSAQHGRGASSLILPQVRSSDGTVQGVDMNVADDGTVTLTAAVAFDGYVVIS